MNVLLNGWAWLPTGEMDPMVLGNLKERLTLTPRVARDYQFDGPPTPVDGFAERDGFIGIPRSYFLANARMEHQIDDVRSEGVTLEEERCTFLGSTSGHERWDEQTRAMETVLRAFAQSSTGGIVRACPAWGKTGFAIRLICNLRTKTLIVVHKDFLLEQWKLRLEKLAPYLRVGVWKQKKEEIEDKDVVVGLVQTLSNREVSSDVADQFGLCIFDEVHRIGARTFSTVPPRFNPRFNLGLSAKPKRADRMDDLFLWHIGPVIFHAEYQTPIPRIHRVHTAYRKPGWICEAEAKAEAEGNVNPIKYPTQMKAMVIDGKRNARIVHELEKILRTSNRKVVVMSERIAHLETLASMLRERDMQERIPDLTMGFYHSKVKAAARQEAERKRVIFSTFQMLEEGFDVSALDTLIMTTARADVEQPVGRIRRECVVGRTVTEQECRYYCPWRVGRCQSKPQPIVVEFTDDDVTVVQRKMKYRSRYYKEIGAQVLEGR